MQRMYLPSDFLGSGYEGTQAGKLIARNADIGSRSTTDRSWLGFCGGELYLSTTLPAAACVEKFSLQLTCIDRQTLKVRFVVFVLHDSIFFSETQFQLTHPLLL